MIIHWSTGAVYQGRRYLGPNVGGLLFQNSRTSPVVVTVGRAPGFYMFDFLQQYVMGGVGVANLDFPWGRQVGGMQAPRPLNVIQIKGGRDNSQSIDAAVDTPGGNQTV